MSALATDDDLKRAAKAAGLPQDDITSGPAPLASPSYMALESLSGRTGGAFVKVMHPEMRDWFDLQAAGLLAERAGAAGVGPAVRWRDAGIGAMAMEALDPPDWRVATQFDLQEPAIVAGAIRALGELHATGPLPHRFDPFAVIDRAAQAILDGGYDLPEDWPWLRRLIGQAEALRDGGDLAPCRNDGSASNLMIGPGSQVRLLDFDRAGMNDPLYDVGVLLAEATEFEADMREGFTAYRGAPDEVAFSRARLWSHVDDMMHAVWARLMAHRSARPAVEWLKYGEWRFLRLRNALHHPQFEEKLRITGAWR